MNNKERLQKLKALQISPGDGPLFKSSHDCMIWIDTVAPLLKYDPTHYENFMDHTQYVRITTLSPNTLMPHLNSMMGILNQAIFELENKIPPSEINSNKTIINISELKTKDLIFASNYRIRLLLLTIFIIGLSIGITFGSSKLYKEKIIPLINLYKTQDAPQKYNAVPITPEQTKTDKK